VDVERLRPLLGPLARAVHARCVLIDPSGRTRFATQPAETTCGALLEDGRRPACASGECPFKGEPYLATLRDGDGVPLGELFWCTPPTGAR
jgi:hypothetical protein